MKLMHKLVAEFIGVFTLVFIGVSAIAMDLITEGHVGLLGIALAHGLAIGVMVAAVGAISGGHLNPAVTFGALLTGKIEIPTGLAYIVAQCLGGIFAAVVVKGAVPSEALNAIGMGTPALTEGVSAGSGILMEMVTTFFLVFVVFGTAMDKRGPVAPAIFIGLTVAIGILAAGPLTGGALNPARHLGPALLGGGLSETWIYWVGPMAGGAIAGILYHQVLEEKVPATP